jgi:citrate synthase
VRIHFHNQPSKLLTISRGLKAMVWEGSVLDANEGIRFHGKTIKDCQKELPKGTSGTEMLPEAMFWLLLTGEVPSVGQTRALSRELAEKAGIPKFVEKMLDDFPTDLHPMTQFACAVSALNYESKFAKAYASGINKADYWEPTFDDSISLLAKLPTIAAKIHQNAYCGGGALPNEVDVNQDWAYNFAAMLGKSGKENEGFQDLLRLYLALHGDHEGGNVSAHATHLVGSALSDPFLSYSAGLQGLAGPLHGLAAQEVLRFILDMQKSVGTNFTESDVTNYLWSILKSGRVIPGYGHAVLRKPDPRFEALMDFANARPEIAANPVYQLVKKNSEVAPGVLTEHGKVSLLEIGARGLLANALIDQESLPQRRLILGRPLPPLRVHQYSVLHCYLWCQSRSWAARATRLGQSIGSAHRASKEYQLAGHPGPGQRVDAGRLFADSRLEAFKHYQMNLLKYDDV